MKSLFFNSDYLSVTVYVFLQNTYLRKKMLFEPVFSTYKADSTGTKNPAEKNEIFYGILTPVEICTIFNRLGVPYNNATLNPTSNRDK